MLEYLGELALAIILVIFMLQQREEFRNRVIRLVGPRAHRRLPPSSSMRPASESAVSCSCKRSSTARSGWCLGSG